MHLRGQLYDDPTHPSYDPVISELLPIEYIVLSPKQDNRDVWKRTANSNLKFPRFASTYDLSLTSTDKGRSQRSLHFEQRLFRVAYLDRCL